MVKKALTGVGIILLSLVVTILTKNYTVVGSDTGGTKGLFSYSQVHTHTFKDQEFNQLYYPPSYLQIGMITTGGYGLCTAVNGLSTTAYGWPFYYSIDDPNCESNILFPILFALDILFYTVLVSLLVLLIRVLTKAAGNGAGS